MRIVKGQCIVGTGWAVTWRSERGPVPRGSDAVRAAAVVGGSRVSLGSGVR